LDGNQCRRLCTLSRRSGSGRGHGICPPCRPVSPVLIRRSERDVFKRGGRSRTGDSAVEKRPKKPTGGSCLLFLWSGRNREGENSGRMGQSAQLGTPGRRRL